MGAERGSLAISAAFAVVIVAWGFNYLFVRVGLDLVAPLWLAFLRAGLGAGGAVFIWLGSGRPALSGRGSLVAAGLGLLNTTAFFGLWFVAAGSVPPGEAATVVYTFPLWVALLSLPVLHLRLRWMTWGAIGVGFLGIVLISEPWGAGGGVLQPVPVAELLLGALSWAVGTVLIQRRFGSASPQAINASQLLGGSAGLFVAALVFEPSRFPSFSSELVAIVLWLGLVGTALGYALWFYLLGRRPAPLVSANLFLVPVVALSASALLLGERIDLIQAGGVAFVAVAIFVVGSRPPARSERSKGEEAPGDATRSIPWKSARETGGRNTERVSPR